MLNKLKALREEREDGFTLIELLVVILIIGILAAIAIPVFLNQRQTAIDGAVQSDTKNAAIQIETWIIDNSSTPVALTSANVAAMGIKESPGVILAIYGNSNNYCIAGRHANSKKYPGGTTATVLTYENLLGGLNQGGGQTSAYTGACALAGGGWLSVP